MRYKIKGTLNFSNFGCAFVYYRGYGYSRDDVRQKVKDGEIYIGKPSLGPGEELHVNDEGRYEIRILEGGTQCVKSKHVNL